jgi:peptide/nickel transport system permease protein
MVWIAAGQVLRLGGTVLLTLLGLLIVTFVIGRVVPIDPVLAVVGDQATPEVYERARLDMGLDRPIPVQFGRYVGKVMHGDFGRSVLTSQPITRDLARFFPATLELATLGLLIGVGLGIPMGVLGATNRGKWVDQVIRVVGLLGYSIPVFWLGLVGLMVFYADLGWVSGPGRVDVAFDDIVDPVTGSLLVDSLLEGEGEVFWNAVGHIILPASILGYFSLAYISRMTRSFMLEQLSQ